MPIYDFRCDKCKLDFETIEKMSKYTGKANCPKCQRPGYRTFSRCKFHFSGTKIEDAEFNVGLGKITKSKRHREELAKRSGAIEIGNEKPETVHKHFDNVQAEKRKKAYDDIW